MKAKKIKRYRMPVSRTFPKTHRNAGSNTWFQAKIELGLMQFIKGMDIIPGDTLWPKLHTIRANYELWSKRIQEVQNGDAVIELYYWSDKPYRSPQVVFATIDKESGCGVQKLGFNRNDNDASMYPFIVESGRPITRTTIAKNDGLSTEDFKDWFKGYDLSEPMAIIHFTSFRY